MELCQTGYEKFWPV